MVGEQLGPLQELARAKVNLYLHVVGRRADGYHLLDSLAVFPGAADVVSASEAETISLSMEGPFGAVLEAGADNLVLRAARALADHAFGHHRSPAKGARITLDKRLPIASGIGGGSADAAATLRLLERLWDLRLDPAVLRRLAQGLGADVPVCVPSAPARMRDIGDRLEPSPQLPPFAMVLVNPGVAVPTADVFRARQGPFSAPARLPSSWADVSAMAQDLAALSNDLEAPARQQCGVIGDVLAALLAQPGCLLARMSGSGATCFGLFAKNAAARAAAERLAFSGWWCWCDVR
jgi:4-diphosphocytidyl-2-C-methyl-D-erythritol kinase